MLVYLLLLIAILIQFPLCSIAAYTEKGIAIRFGNDRYLNITTTELLFFIDFVLLICIAALRNQSVGTDSKTYFFWIDQLHNYSFLELHNWVAASGIEIGYAIVSKVVMAVFRSREVVLVVINSIILIGILILSKQHGNHIIFSLFLFLAFSMYNQSMNINAQYIAAIILAVSIKYLHEKDIKKFIALVIIATLFHTSAIIGLVFIPMAYFEKSAIRYSLIIIAVAFIGSLFAPRVINAIVSRTVYSVYLYKEIGSESGIGLAMNLLIFAAFAVFYQQFREQDEYAHFWLYSAALAIALNFYIGELAMIGRMMIYFKMTYLVSIPSFINSFKDKRLITLISMYVVLLFSIYYWHSVSGSCFGTTPYVSDILGIN